MTYFDKNALKLSHEYLKANVKKGDICIDATTGRGRDTLLLSMLTGNEGKVYAFDIQREAIISAKTLLDENGRHNTQFILDSHDKMSSYIKAADCAVFNLGFLPGGDHSIFSRPETSIKAINEALNIINPQGFVSICSYYGGDTGYEERDALLNYLSQLDSKKYTVMLHSFYNRPNCPPLFIIIEKNR